MTYTAYKGLPFSYYARKAQYYDIAASEVATQDTTYTPTFEAYSGLNLEYKKNSTSLPLIYVRGKDLPDHQPHEDFIACLDQSGSTYSATIQKYNNFIVVGNPYIDENLGVLVTQKAGYIHQSISNVGSVWDIYLKITTPETTTGGQQILTVGTQNSEYKNVLIFMDNAGTNMYAKTSNDGSTNVLTGTTAITPNTTYWLNIGCDGTNTYFKISTDEFTTVTTVGTVAAVTIIPDTSLFIGYGVNYTSKGYFGGVIDLTQTYLNVNNSTVWKPLNTSLTPTNYKLNNFNVIGAPSIDYYTGKVSSFSTSKYLTLPSNFAPSNNTWEMNWKIKTGSGITTEQYVFCFGTVNSTNNARGIRLAIKSSKIITALSFDGETKVDVNGTTTLAKNTEYLIKVEFTGTAYNIYLNGTLDASYTSSSAISSGDKNFIGAAFVSNAVGSPFGGEIDLVQSSIIVNNQVWWQPYTKANAYETESFKGILVGTDDGSAKTYNLFYNKGTYLLDTVETKTGYSWAGSVYVPSHTV